MRALLLTLAVLTLTAPAAAQDGSEMTASRTPENAQQFLQVAAERFGLLMEGDSGMVSGRFVQNKLRYGNLQVSSDDKCKTRFDGTINEFWFKDDAYSMVASGPNTTSATINALAQQHGRSHVKAAPYVIDWSTVSEVGVATDYDPEKGTRNVPQGAFARSKTQSITLIAPSEDVAGRVRLAMETLRLACDPTQALGF